MEAKVYNSNGEITNRTVQLPEHIFGIEPNDHAIYLDVKQHLANRRQGTHKSKDKSEVNYSTRKLKRQKGTGTARAGSRKSGIMIGGGRFHGPRPRDYSFKLNKKLKELARFSALTYKAKEQKVLVVEALSFDKPSTKSFVNLLGKLDLTGKRTLFLLDNNDSNIVLSGRNIPKNKMIPATNVNTYEVMLANHLIITENALTKLTETFNKN
jgi:large subunit ribosomal protein L4